MNKRSVSIDLAKLAIYFLKRIWIIIICAIIGFGVMYFRASRAYDTYTASGTMFVTNSNPNLVNYGYTSTNDISSAVQLVNIYCEVIKGENVMQRVLEYQIDTAGENDAEQNLLLSQKYPGITTDYIRSVLSMQSINETPMVLVSCTTFDPQLSADICNAILQVAPAAIQDVISAGDAKTQDYATVPMYANDRNDQRSGLIGALSGIVLACGALFVLFLMNNKVDKSEELNDNYTPPILSNIRRRKGNDEDPAAFLLSEQSDMDQVESYAKLRMNLLFTLSGKEKHTVLVTSAISGEGKSTVTANLAVSIAMSGKRVLLVDADMRRACQSEIFHYSSKLPGLSDVLIGGISLEKAVRHSFNQDNMDILPAGTVPPNPCELLESPIMQQLLEKLETKYDIILMDVPPINIVSDPLALSSVAAGALFVVRQSYSDQREIRRALIAAELTGLEILGFVFYGERLHQGSYYGRKSYQGYKYYHKYDTRHQTETESDQS